MITWLTRTVDYQGQVRTTPEALPWVRRRLALELHARWYHDSGVEVHPSGLGVDRSGYTVRTPHCLQGDRNLGTLDEVESTLNQAADGWGWERFRTEFIASVNASSWATRRHLGCFHRRGLARFDLSFALATEIAHLTASATTRIHTLDGSSRLPEAMAGWWAHSGWSLPTGKAPRVLTVVHNGEVVAALRTDGMLASQSGNVNVAEEWRAGHSLTTLAKRVVDK